MGGWANRLKLFLWNNWEKYQTNVYHLGINGDTTDQLLRRFDLEAEMRNPDILIFAIGINDSVFWKDNRKIINETDFANNITNLIEKAHKYTETIIFVGLTNIVDKILQPYEDSTSSKCYSEENVKKFSQILEKTCSDKNVYYIPMLGLIKEGDLSDGLHPNTDGHKKMFEKISGYLIENKII